MTKRALIVIDIQNDYFQGGAYPLFETEQTMKKNLQAISRAHQLDIPVIHVQHFVSPEAGEGLFFYENTPGVDIYPSILAAAPDAPIITKRRADCFEGTNLEAVLTEMGVEEIILTGMMTHNCVIHTALSPAAAKYQPKVIEECVCSIDPMTHALAVDAMLVRGIELLNTEQALS